MTDDNAALPRKAKGKRPYFFDNEDVDKLLAMIMALTGEVSVLRDRLDTVEKLLASKGHLSDEEIENYIAPDHVLAQRAGRRQEMLSEITRVVYTEIEGLSRTDDAPYEQAIDLVENDTAN